MTNSTSRTFVDTNVLVYSRDANEPEKRKAALQWLGRLWRTRSGRTGFQVLLEYYVTVTQKLDPPLDLKAAREDVRSLLLWKPLPPTREMVEEAWAIQDRYGLSWWDALIVAGAILAGCSTLLTEDLQDGQDFGGVRVVNPFRSRT